MNHKVTLYVFARDNYHCRHCNRGDTLDPHHVVFRSHGGEDKPNNLLTLCRKCHDDVHAGRLKIETMVVHPSDREVKFWRQEGWKP